MPANSVVHEFILKDAVSSVLQKIVKNSEAATDRITKSLGKIDKRAEANAKSLDNLGNTFKKFAGIASVALAGVGIASFVSDSIAAAGHLKTLETGFAAVTKSAEKAKSLTGLRAEFAKLPVPLQETDKAMNRLVGAGVHGAAEMSKELRKLSAVAIGAHASVDDLGLIYERVKMGGKLQGEQMAQMIDRGIPIAHALAEVKNVNESKIKSMISKGEISFNDFNKALDHMTHGSGVYATILDDMARTTEGKSNIISNRAQLMGENFGKAFLPAKLAFQEFQMNVLDKMAPVLDKIAKGLVWVIDNAKTILVVVAPLAAIWAGYTLTIVAHTVALKALAIASTTARLANILLTGGFAKLNMVLAMNPVGLVVAGIAALATIITVAWQKSETFRGVVLGTWEVMKDFASALGDMFTSPWQTIKNIFTGISDFVKNMIAPLMETIDHIKNGRWLEAAKSGGKFLVNLTPIGIGSAIVDKIANSEAFKRGFAKGKDPNEVFSPDVTSQGINRDNSVDHSNSNLDLSRTEEKAGSSSGTAKTITLNIGNLIGEFKITSNGVKESIEDIKKLVTQAIVESVRDSEVSFG